MVDKVLLKRFCNTCHKETTPSEKKRVHIRGKVVGFKVCLNCGNPYGYSSFDSFLSSFYGQTHRKKRSVNVPKTKTKKTKKQGNINYIGRAGLLKGTYKLYLNTEHWKEIRKKKLESKPICEMCKKEKATQVHHLYYNDRNGKSILYKEKLSDLVSVCKKCHEKIHNL
jgi:hypothetical protein